jgi:hypothetical protein
MSRQLAGFTLAAALLMPSCTSGDRPSSKMASDPMATPSPSSEPDLGEARMENPTVVVNGRALSLAQLEALKQIYGVIPAEGRWWYDAMSGMYGAEGQGATGFMYPGHDLGPLATDASHGDMPVFINGRQLTQVEVNYLAWLAGGAVAPGRYWVDAQLNWGYDGVPIPAGNLRQLAAARSGGGRGGGDNTWSGLVGSGNYNDDNTVGYVSIPGVGPIGSYGM